MLKNWRKSWTMIAAGITGTLGIVEANTGLLQAVIPASGWGYVLLALAIKDALLRIKTTSALADK